MEKLLLVLAMVVPLAACGGDDGGGSCAIGALGCACTAGGGCDQGLTCNAAMGRCEVIGDCLDDLETMEQDLEEECRPYFQRLRELGTLLLIARGQV